MGINPVLDERSETPIYRQLYDSIRSSILDGSVGLGDRLPPTRELAGQLGLNRATVSAAYELLEQDGLIRGHVGRGSFVADGPISFATSRPLEELFPLDDFRISAREVLADPAIATILQLGAPQGYGPLRDYLSSSGDVLITTGCQQALDLLQRVLAPAGSTVLVEDPTYPGLKNVFENAGVRLAPLGTAGARSTLAIVTPNFQNPTGRSMPLEERERLVREMRDRRTRLVELDIYSALRYRGEELPSLLELDGGANVIQIGSFSKIAFPGLRVGWVKAPRDVAMRLVEAKQWTDLHTDQLAQAILLRFAESGRLDAHRRRVVEHGASQLQAALSALDREMPYGTEFTRPDGGMNLWVRLPAPLDAAALLPEAQRMGVAYLPSRYFAVGEADPAAFRLSFGGLSPERIARGVTLLGEAFRREIPAAPREFATALV